MEVYILYRDLRSYGLRGDLYREARKKGILFLQYNESEGVNVFLDENNLKVQFSDTVLRRKKGFDNDQIFAQIFALN